ncbi:hypothetical protein vseg_005482 [Gypsophila vaccaria]
MAENDDLTTVLPRVLIVSRRTVRKNKFVDFVGEYHLDLIMKYGAVPVIVPRVAGIHMHLESFEPIHGVLLCEGEDIDPSHYQPDLDSDELSPDELNEVRLLHASDTAIDKEKDSIEFQLTKLCLDRDIPFLGICRGSQVLNVACGGTLYQDIDAEISRKLPEENRVNHMNYDNYDEHRHKIRVLEGTPLHKWFKDPLEEDMDMNVSSYHHQGVKKLARRFVPMAYAPDGLIEGYYDPDTYKPKEGKFVMGLQFHPERMRQPGSDEFDHPGCPCVYEDFVKAVIAYKKRVASATNVPKSLKSDLVVKRKKKRVLVRSFSLLASDTCSTEVGINPNEKYAFKVESDFLTFNTVMSQHEEKKLKEVGATVRNAFTYVNTLKVNGDKQKMAKKMMDKMSEAQLTDMVSFYHTMAQICSDVLAQKLHNVAFH